MSSWGEQFSTGDQGVDRITFWEKDFKICPKCNWTGKFTNTTHCAGCRMNGDGYGTEVFKCEGCGWQTSFLYDESGDLYYYESRAWRTPPVQAVKPKGPVAYRGFDEEMTTKYNIVVKLASEWFVRENMKRDGIFPEEIDKFFAAYNARVGKESEQSKQG